MVDFESNSFYFIIIVIAHLKRIILLVKAGGGGGLSDFSFVGISGFSFFVLRVYIIRIKVLF